MSLNLFEDLNNERFLREAFDAKCRKKLIQSARLRRNTYLGLFLTGFVCIFMAGLSGLLVLSILSLFLSTLALVVMTKYDTQLLFLKMLQEKEEGREA